MEDELLEHFSFGECEQLGGFYRAKEEFNGIGAVASYLNDKGDNHEIYDNRTSNCARSPKHIRACTRRDEYGKSRQSLLWGHYCRYRPYSNQAQEYLWECACSHRARSKRINTHWVSCEPWRLE